MKRKGNFMIDLHIHILPALDDGAADREMALEMARRAYAGGSRTLCATPHSYAKRSFYAGYPDDITEAALRLSAWLAEASIDLEIRTGMEVLLEPTILGALREGKLLTLGGSRWLLIEFYGGESPSEMMSMLRSVINMGYSPLIAHAERYKAIQKHPKLAAELIELGCAIQVNARSLTGESDRKFVKTARRLCAHRWVHAVASDGHNALSRPPLLDGAHDWLAQQYSKKLADRLTADNPAAILANASLAELRWS